MLNQNRPLLHRIMMPYKVAPLRKEEVAGYIQHHMELAGTKHTVFTDTAVEAIVSLSRGWPWLVNKLAIHCLLYDCQAKKEQIDEEVVKTSYRRRVI